MENYNYGLKINQQLVKVGDKIKITRLIGYSNLAYLFSKNIIDEVIIEFNKHEKYNTFILNALLKKNEKYITVAERFEYSKEEIEDSHRAKSTFIVEPFEINVDFAHELELSEAVFI